MSTAAPSFDQQQAAFSWASDQVQSLAQTVSNTAVTVLELGRRHAVGLQDVGERDEYWRFWLLSGSANPGTILAFKLLAIGEPAPVVADLTPGATLKPIITESAGLNIGIRITPNRPNVAVLWIIPGAETEGTLLASRYFPYRPDYALKPVLS